MFDENRTGTDTGDALSRRDFLKANGLGLASWGLASPAHFIQPLRIPDGERSVILLLLVGGPSSHETFDPKPDAPAEMRGPFESIATRIPGIRVSQHLPRLANRMDRVALVRSLHHDEAPIHETGLQLLQTGRCGGPDDECPHFGSVLARVVGHQHHSGAPASVILPGRIASTGVDIPHGQSGGCLGASYDPLFIATSELSDESERLREEYGTSTFGRDCLAARRLIERGVRCVTINMFDRVFGRVSWDAHGASPFSTFDDYARTLLPTFDRAFAALLDDLERSGRLETTLVVAAGEFGRTPRINATGGRDHWPGVWTAVLAGGGIRGGQVIGASDAHGAEPIDRPITLPDLLATIYHSQGIDPKSVLTTPDGRSFPLTTEGQPIRELFS